ncbi:MAG: MarR family transcriptional regulator [Anaerolineae bacterium]|nr:MarR family transcriptional regulator [Anaerolineae bacterium]
MPTKYQGSPEVKRALDTYIKLTRAAESVLDRTNAHLAAHNLTTTQFGVLEALYHLGTLSQVELARKLLKSTGNVTTVLQNLEKRTLISRERDQNDQRYVQVSITPEGQRLLESILPAHFDGIVADLSVLTAEEQETLACLCRKLGLRQIESTESE